MDLIATPVVFGQSPPENSIVHSTSVSLTSRSPSDPVHLVQYDDTLPMVAVALISNSQPYTVPSGAAVNVRLAKSDGHYVYNPAYGVSDDGQTVYIAVTVQMTAVSGKVSPIIEVVVNGKVAGTGFFVLDIDPNPIPEDAIESTDEYKTIQQLAAEVTQAAQIVRDNAEGIQYVQENAANITAVAQNRENISAVGESIANVNSVAENLTPIQTAADNIAAIQQAPASASAAAASATLSKSWAVGGTGSREGEDTNNAKYYCEQAQSVTQGQLGWYATPQDLQAAHPTGQNGQWAIIGTTDTIWTWDSDTSAWVDTGAQVDLSNYYTKQQADAAFATAAQGQLAQSAVQSINGKTGSTVTLAPSDIGAAALANVLPNVLVAGLPGIRSLAYQQVDLLNVDSSNPTGEVNTPMFFGSDSPGTQLINAPYTSGPFYGFRQVLMSRNNSGTIHLVTVILIETYPTTGRIWGNTYDMGAKTWYGWKQNGAQAATLAYDEMAAAYNEGVASVGQ